MNRDPMSSRHPFEIFLLVLAIVSGLPVALGFAPPPTSIQAKVPGWPSWLWSASLVFGSALALAGVLWPPPRDRRKLSVTGVSLEQIGLVMVAGAAIFFVAVVIIVAGGQVAIPAAIILAYGASCGWRAWQLQRLLRGPRRSRSKGE